MTHGVPSQLLSDNVSYYLSQEFKSFSKEWNFQHITSLPHYPRSNGLSERAVKSAKSLLRKSQKDNTDVQYALLLLRNTPRDNNLKSPSERLYLRKTNIGMPATDFCLQPRAVKNVQTNLYNKRMTQKISHDKTAKPLPELLTNQAVRLQTDRGHEKIGDIKDQCNPISYTVSSEGKDY